MKTTLASIITASVFALFVQASYADVETYHAHGVVESVDTTNKTLTLKQDAVTPVKGYLVSLVLSIIAALIFVVWRTAYVPRKG